MKTISFGNIARRMFLFLTVASLTFFASCSDDDSEPGITVADQDNTSSDAQEDFYFEDADDMASVSLETSTAGRVATDERLACAEVTYTGNKEAGTLRIDFGDGCTGPHGRVRKGVIVITHVGRWHVAGSHWTITFENYSVNDIQVEGTRTVTVESVTETLVKHNIELVGGKVTWPDGRFATREVSRKREYERNENTLLDRLIIHGTANGVGRNGRSYSIEILEPLVYTRACKEEGIVIPVSGKKLIKHGDREITIDYGDGACDNIVTITNKNGRTVQYEVGND